MYVPISLHSLVVGRVDGEIEAGQIKLIAARVNEMLIDGFGLSLSRISEFFDGLRVLLEVVIYFRADLLNEVLAMGAGCKVIQLVDVEWCIRTRGDSASNRAGPIVLVDLDNALTCSSRHAAHTAGIARD